MFDLLVSTIVGIQREDPEPPLASVVKTAMQRKVPDFHESDLGFASYTRFLQAAAKKGLISLSRDQKSGGYRVDVLERKSGGRPRPPTVRPEAPAGPERDCPES